MKYFGTDGIRGTYGELAVSEPFYIALGEAVAEILREGGGGKVVVGGDTRASTSALAQAFCDGLKSGGAEFENVGVLPTPALAYCVIKKGAKIGAMITASHNPYCDNGIKFFDENANKASDELQDLIEARLEKFLQKQDVSSYKPCEFSATKISAGEFAKNDYVEKMSSIFPAGFLKGVKVAIDMANGATSGVSCEVLRRYGAEVFEAECSPTGLNINESVGSQHPENIVELCKKVGADAGFAHDGDGDRVVVVDDKFSILEGEEVLALITEDAASRGALKAGAIVTTLQSNLGLDETLLQNGIKVFRSGIGDRLVAAMMRENSCNIGGENSGHFIFSDVSPCGDGLASALSVLSVVVNRGKKLSSLRGGIKMYPQLSKAIKVERKPPIDQTQNLCKAMASAEVELGAQGRILVRYSGTEKKIRLLVEGRDEAQLGKIMKSLQEAVEIDLQ